MSKSVNDLSAEFSDFCKERQWHHEDPNQLLSAIHIELGELAEHYQWQNKFPKWDEEEKKSAGYEFVDVLLYFLRLAELSGIDIEKYFDEKLPKLAKKFPAPSKNEILTKEQKITDNIKSRKAYRKEGKNKLYD